jgi:hypothetical protein
MKLGRKREERKGRTDMAERRNGQVCVCVIIGQAGTGKLLSRGRNKGRKQGKETKERTGRTKRKGKGMKMGRKGGHENCQKSGKCPAFAPCV